MTKEPLELLIHGGGLLLTVGVLTWAAFTHGKPISVEFETQAQRSSWLVWQTAPRLFLEESSAPRIKAKKHLGFHVWNGGTFIVDLLTSGTPLLRQPGVTPYSGIDSDSEMRLYLAHTNLVGAKGILKMGGSVGTGGAELFVLVLLGPHINDTKQTVSSNRSHWHGTIYGTEGRPFEMEHGFEEETLTGQFGSSEGVIGYHTDPPQWNVPFGKDMYRDRLHSESTTPPGPAELPMTLVPESIRNEAATIVATEDAQIDMTATITSMLSHKTSSGHLLYAEKTRAIFEGMTVSMEFPTNSPGKLVLIGPDTRIKITGTPTKVLLDDENITPRRIEEWPWHAQMMIGMLITFFGERAVNAMKRLAQRFADGYA